MTPLDDDGTLLDKRVEPAPVSPRQEMTHVAFQLPRFNLVVNRWLNGVPTANPPTAVLAGQFRTRAGVGLTRLGAAFPAIARLLLLPAKTIIVGTAGGALADTVEVPAGTGRFYSVEDHDDVARGFPTEYRLCLIIPTAQWNQES